MADREDGAGGDFGEGALGCFVVDGAWEEGEDAAIDACEPLGAAGVEGDAGGGDAAAAEVEERAATEVAGLAAEGEDALEAHGLAEVERFGGEGGGCAGGVLRVGCDGDEDGAVGVGGV